MNPINFFTAKGGQGCTVVAAATAIALSRRRREPVLMYAADPTDLIAVLGVYPDAPAVAADGIRVQRLCAEIDLVEDPDEAQVLDWGTNYRIAHDGVDVLVTRLCYVALRRYALIEVARPVPTGVVVLVEHGRALHVADIAHVVGAPVVAELAVHPDIARVVDAGLLASRLPNQLLAVAQTVLDTVGEIGDGLRRWQEDLDAIGAQ
jgi:hypothetical protein